MLLALVMVFGMMPVNALATEFSDQTVEETQAVEPAAQTEEPVEEATETPEETQAPTEEPTEAPTEEAVEAPTETVEETTAVTQAPVEEETEPEEEAEPVETVTGNASAPAMDSVAEETEVTEPEEEIITVHTGHAVPSISGLPSDKELFAAYANNVLYGNGAVTLGTAAYDALPEGNVKLAYEALKPIIQDIAAGKRSSATVTMGYSFTNINFGDGAADYPAEVEIAFTGTSFTNEDCDQLLNALLADMPYELYWFDKTIGMYCEYFWVGNRMQIELYFCVAANYAQDNLIGGFEVDTAVTGAASAVAATAEKVAKDNVAGMTDYEKLVYFKDYICGKVSYDYDAVNYGWFSEDDDPWQLIHVFDTDSTTNVVCEGYSKAFQYLCDLTTFQNKTIRCYNVTGAMVDASGAEAHMWNIVTIDGVSYMVDVTNTDKCEIAGYVNFGEDGSLFLSGTAGSIADGYTFTNKDGNTVKYIYTYTENGYTDTTSVDTWGSGADSILNLSETSYDPNAAEEILPSGTCGENLTWAIEQPYEDDLEYFTLTITGEGAMRDYSESDPAPWSGYKDIINAIYFDGEITSIGAYAFADFTALSSGKAGTLSIPGTVTKIGEGAYRGCKGFGTISIPASVTEIGKNAFAGASMTTVKFKGNVPQVGATPFGENKVMKAHYPADNETWTDEARQDYGAVITWIPCDENGNALEGTCGTNVVWKFDRSTGTLTISGSGAMSDYATKKNNPPWSSFEGDIAAVVIEEGITYLGSYMLSGYTAVTSLHIPASVTEIGSGIAEGCTALTEIHFAGDAPTMQEDIFTGVTATAYYPAGNATWNSEVMQSYGGTITWKAYADSSAMSLADFLANARPSEDNRYQVNTNVYVKENLSLANQIVEIVDGAQLTVENGAVLTIGYTDHLVTTGGSITVEAGSRIDNYGIMANDGGIITVNDGAEAGYRHLTGVDEYGNPTTPVFNTHFSGTVLNTVNNVPTVYQNLVGTVDNANELNTILALAEDYNYVNIWTASGMELGGTIADNVQLSVDGQEKTAVLTVSNALTNKGKLALGNVILNVAKDATLTNNGNITTDVHDRAAINVEGSLVINSGSEFNLNKAAVTVNGTLVNRTGMFINDGSVMNVNGTLNNYDCLHVGYWKMSQEEIDSLTQAGQTGLEFSEIAGTLSINGTMNNYYYMNTGAHTENSGGIVNVNGSGKLNLLMDEDERVCGHIDHAGQLNILGEMVIERMTSIMAFVESSVKVASSGTLTNNGSFGFVTELNGDDVDDGSRGALVIDGTLINNNRVSIDTRATATVNGTLINRAELIVQGLVEVEGSVTNNGTIYVEDNGVLDVKTNGSFTDNGKVIYSGSSGENLIWRVSDGILTISGSGAMMDYANGDEAPWGAYADHVTKIRIEEGITRVGEYAFENFLVESVLIPKSVVEIAYTAFAGGMILRVYHGSVAIQFADEMGIEHSIIHEMENGCCIYDGCELSLSGILTNTDTAPEEKAEELKNIDTESLKTEMENNSGIADQIEELEKDLAVDVSVVVPENTSTEVTKVFSNVSADAIVGAVVNAAEEVTEVKLVISDAATDFVDETEYDTENGVVFSMTLEGVEDASDLDVPVKITLPVPAGIDTSKLKVLHYHDGEVTEVNFVLSADKTSVSFILTGFSGFAMVEEIEPEIEKFNLTGITATFGNSLALNFVIDTAKLSGDGHYAVVTKEYADGRRTEATIRQSDWPVYSGNLRYFSFDGIAAKEMMDTVTAVVYNSKDQAVTNAYVTSLRDYCVKAWNQEAAKAAPDTDKLTQYIDMLNYGAAAQVKFGYDTGNLANADLTETQQSYATPDSAVTGENIFVKGTGCVGTTLTLVSQIELNFVFQNEVIDQASYAIATFTNHYGAAKEIRIETFPVYNSTMKYVPVSGMSAADCGNAVTLKLYDSEGNVLSTCVESMTSLCIRATSSNDLYWACLKYCQASYQYFH